MKPSDLAKLTQECIKAITAARDAGKIRVFQRLRIFYELTSYVVSPHGSSANTTQKAEPVSDWSITAHLFLEEQGKRLGLDEYAADILLEIRAEEGESAIGIYPNNPELRAAHFLKSFLSSVISEALENGMTDDDLNNRCVDFISELRGGRFDIEVESGITNCFVHGLCEINPGVFIREISREDINKHLKAESSVMAGDTPIGRGRYPASLVRFSYKARNVTEGFDKVGGLIRALRLYSAAGITEEWISCRVSAYTKSFGQPMVGSGSAAPRPVALQIDGESLKDLLKALPLIVEGVEKFVKSSDSYKTSLTRYERILIDWGHPVARVASLMMGIEPLLTKKSENTAVRYRMCMRGARLFGLLGFKAEDIFDALNRGYEIRNKYVHGLKIEKEDGPDAEMISVVLVNIQRVLLTMGPVRPEVPWENVLQHTDEALMGSDKKLAAIAEGISDHRSWITALR